jgi:hypothetical protein
MVWLLCVVLAVGVGLSAQGNSPEEKQVVSALETLFAAYPARDRATLEKYLHDDLSYGHMAGNIDGKAAHIEDVMSKRVWELVALKPKTVVKVSGPVAVVRAIMDIRNGPSKDQLRLAADRAVLLILVKGDQNWQLIARQ